MPTGPHGSTSPDLGSCIGGLSRHPARLTPGQGERAVHQFGSEAGASVAVVYFADTRMVLFGSQVTPITPMGDGPLAIAGQVGSATEARVQGRRTVVIRVIATFPTGDPLADAIRIAEVVLAT